MTPRISSREFFRELARQELERNPPPPASPELIAKLRAIFAGAQTPNTATAGLADPAAAEDHRPAANEWKSDGHESNSVA